MALPPNMDFAAQTDDEAIAFIEAFAQVNVAFIRENLSVPAVEAETPVQPPGIDWDSPHLLAASGLTADEVDQRTRAGQRFLHIEAAAIADIRHFILGFTGLSDKQQKALFPQLYLSTPTDYEQFAHEVVRLNAWLRSVQREGFDPARFVEYQRSLNIHGQVQNLSGAIGATGAAIAFVDAIQQLDPTAIVDHEGAIPPVNVRSPLEIYEWRKAVRDNTLKAILLRNGRALVFASSKDANIFKPTETRFNNAKEALRCFNSVRKNQRARMQVLHEYAVGEVKTATDRNNLHERMGLASRETQTELRTDRFLMMAVLNKAILEGGEQQRRMNNRDLTRFSHVFNLHHCWGWDGGRVANQAHWDYFVENVKEWCGL